MGRPAMPIDASKVKWDDDTPDPSKVTWDDAPEVKGNGGAVSAPAIPENTLGQAVKRQGGLFLRAALNAAASPAVILDKVQAKASDALTGKHVGGTLGEDLNARLTGLGLPTAERSMEKFTQGMAETVPAFALPGGLIPQVAGNAAINSALAAPGHELNQALLGGALGAVGHAAGGVIKPTAAAKTLIDRGVALTPGQAAGAGSGVKTVEELATSLPIASHFIRSAQRRAVEDSNVAAAQVVAKQVNETIKLGRPPREAIEQTRELIGTAYDEALAGVSVPLASTANAMQDLLPTIAKNHPLVPAEELSKAGRYIESRFRGLWDNGVRDLSGAQIKQIDSEIGQHIRDLSRSTNTADKTAAPLWRDLQNEVRDRIVKSVPTEQGQQLSRANAAYRELLALEKAMLPGADAFTPRRLRASLEKAGIKGTGLNMVAEAMHATLPNTVPNSGTAERLLANSLPALLMGGGATAQGLGYDNLGTGLVAAGALGSRAGARAMTGSLPMQQAIAQALRRTLPSLAASTREKEGE